MKKILSALFFSALACFSLNAQEKRNLKLAEELMTVMNTKEMVDASFSMGKKMMQDQLKGMQKSMGHTEDSESIASRSTQVMEIIEKEMRWENIRGQFIEIYAEIFTESELKGLVDFYKSPLGQSFLKKQPELMERAMRVTQKIMADLMPKILEMGELTKQKSMEEESSPKKKESKKK